MKSRAKQWSLEKEVMITYFENLHYEKIIGTIHCFDELKKEFRMMDQAGNVHRISVKEIEQIVLIDE